MNKCRLNQLELESTINRIRQMEYYFDFVQNAESNGSIDKDVATKDMLQILIDYYENGQWLADYECDERGELPTELKRGILSEDALYIFLCDIEYKNKIQNKMETKGKRIFYMKKYLKEIIVLVIQLMLFYLLPLFAGPTDAIGMVMMIILGTFVLSIILGAISKNDIKFLYPIVIAILFLPSIFIYYNETAVVHAVWYLVDSAIGIAIGSVIGRIFS